MTIDLYPAPSTSWRWKYGLQCSGVYNATLTTNYGWEVRYNTIPKLNTGKIWPHNIRAHISLMESTNCSYIGFTFGLINTVTSQVTPLRLNGSNYTIDVSTVSRVAGWQTMPLPSTLCIDVSSDNQYCFGLVTNKITLANNYVGIRIVKPFYSNMYLNALGSMRTIPTTTSSTSSTSLTNIPNELSTTFFIDQGGSSPLTHSMELEFSFNKRKLMTLTPSGSTVMGILLPLPVDSGKKAWMKFNSIYANTSQYVNCEFRKMVPTSSDSTNASTNLQTFRLDMGSTDYVSLNGTQVKLNAVTPEINNKLDFGFCYDSTTLNCFWVNRTIGQGGESTADKATFSHAAKATGNRSTHYNMASTTSLFFWLTFDATTFSSIEIGSEMAVVLGDSQSVLGNGTLGDKFIDAFNTIGWDGSISGNRFSQTAIGSHKAAYLRYQSTAAGNGDICDMRDVLLFDAGMGLNDVSAMVSTNENKRDWTVSEIGRRLFEVFGDAKNNGNQGFILGLPPYSSTVNASMEENRAIRDQLNPAKEAIAIGCRCAFANPYNDMLDVTQNSTVFGDVFKAAYCTGGDHYDSTGASIAINRLLISHNSKTVGGGWAKGFNGLVIGNVIG